MVPGTSKTLKASTGKWEGYLLPIRLEDKGSIVQLLSVRIVQS